ncbi:MAG: hypothetical protein WBB86_05385, partial [Candidatus Omnitrophota bacterium]
KVASAVTSTAKKVASAVTSTAKKVADKVAEKFNEVKEKVITTYNDVKEKVSEAREKAEEVWNDTKEKAGELWEKAKEEYNSRKEANNARKQNAQQDKPFVDSLVDFFTIIPGVSAASPDEDDFSGDTFSDESGDGQCSIDNQNYDPSLQSNNLNQDDGDSGLIAKIFNFFNFTQNETPANDLNSSNILSTSLFDLESNSDYGLVSDASGNAAYNDYIEIDYENMCVADDLSNLRFSGDGSHPMNFLIDNLSSNPEQVGFGLYFGSIRGAYIENNFITRDMIRRELANVIDDVYLPGGMVPKKGLVLDVHGGRLSPHMDEGAINIADKALAKNTLKNVEGPRKGPIIQTKTYDDVPTILNWLDKKGATANKVYYENVPAPRSQVEVDAKAIGNLLEDGATVEYVPRPDGETRLLARAEFQKKGGYIQEDDLFLNKNVYKSADDDLARAFQSKSHGKIVNTKFNKNFQRPKTQFDPTGTPYKPGYKYTIKNEPIRSTVDDLYDDVIKNVDNSMDDGVKAAARSAAKNAAKTAPKTAFKAMKYAAVPLMVIGIALDAKDLYDAHQKDKLEGGHRNLTATSGRVAGAWAGAAIGAKGGAMAGAAIGALFGGVGAVPGAIIGGILGGIIGGVAGSMGGEYVATKAYDKATEEKPATQFQNPLTSVPNPVVNLLRPQSTVSAL